AAGGVVVTTTWTEGWVGVGRSGRRRRMAPVERISNREACPRLRLNGEASVEFVDAGPRLTVHRFERVERARRGGLGMFERGLDEAGNIRKPDPLVEEKRDGGLVRGVEHGRRRSPGRAW